MPKSSYFPHWDLDLFGSVWCVLAFQEFFWGAGGVYCDNLMLLENEESRGRRLSMNALQEVRGVSQWVVQVKAVVVKLTVELERNENI